ncbi:MAG: hypothetical protein ACLFWM_06155 [Actinomycetota bacterium]
MTASPHNAFLELFGEDGTMAPASDHADYQLPEDSTRPPGRSGPDLSVPLVPPERLSEKPRT